MPAKWLKPKCRYIPVLMALVVGVPVAVDAQTGSVTLQARVSETVDLSIVPTFPQGDVVRSGSNTLQVTLSGDGESSVVRVPLLVRSNSTFKVTATLQSQTAVLTQLSVIDVRSTGNLVSPGLVNSLVTTPEVNLDVSQPLLVLSGPRVSLGGTLNSPGNALQVTLLIRMTAEPGRSSLAHLTLTAMAGPPIQ